MPRDALSPADRKLADLYRASSTPRLVELPPLAFLMIDGHGDPNTCSGYSDAVQALYALSYGLKFAIERSGGTRHRVGPLEGLWWAADPGAFLSGDKSSWDWTAMIRQPAEVTAALVEQVGADVGRKKALAALAAVRLEWFAEGSAAQLLHVGPYSSEGPSIARLHDFIAAQGRRLAGKHHEIYLSDPRRAAPERLRTILRQPVAEG
jgi:hypothetical protein